MSEIDLKRFFLEQVKLFEPFSADKIDEIIGLSRLSTFEGNWPQARILLTEGLGHQRLLQAAPVIAAALAYLRGEKIGMPATPASVSRCY